MKNLPKNAALVIIDVQKGFEHPKWGKRNNLHAEENIKHLLEAWRKSNRPVFYVQHLSKEPDSPLRPETSGSEIKDIVKPHNGENIIQKNVNSAFIGTNFEQRLRENDIDTLIITGLTTPHCVSTTTRMAGNLGFDTYLISDATAAFDLTAPDGKHFTADEIHETTLATLHQEFATVVETKTILQQI